MKEGAFKGFLKELMQVEPEERIPRIRETWPSLTKEQQQALEEFLEQLREEPEEEVRGGDTSTEAARRPVASSREEALEETPPEQAIYTPEETSSTEETPEPEERREPYRTGMTERGALTIGGEEERREQMEEGEYVRAPREEPGEKATVMTDEFDTMDELGSSVDKRFKKKYVEEH